MTKALCLALAAALLATTSVHAASDLAKKAGAAPTAVVTPAPGAILRRPAIALFGLYSWGGFGLGARVEWPLAQNLIKEVAYPNEIVGVGGIEYYTQSYSLFTSNYRWNFVRIEAGAMWNFWFTDRFAAYPKLTLGYDVGWLSGWDNAFGPTPSGGGIAIEGALGVIYDLNKAFQLRGEIGNGSLKAGIGIRI